MKSRCPSCKRLVTVYGNGEFVKHRTGRSPRHCVAIKKGSQAGTHRQIVPRAINKSNVKPVCKNSTLYVDLPV
jgi:hypothetical protein